METCWTLVKGAARGDQAARETFATTYMPIVRAYLGSRWRRGPLADELEDAAQDVFLDCLRDGGPLLRLEPGKQGRFRSWLFAVTRNVARRYEERQIKRRGQQSPSELGVPIQADEPTQSLIFDRAWAQTLTRRAAERQAREAHDAGSQRRVELLRLRFHEGLPIRDIAELWGEDAARIHHEYARARDEFKAALRTEVRLHTDADAAEVERECAEILGRL